MAGVEGGNYRIIYAGKNGMDDLEIMPAERCKDSEMRLPGGKAGYFSGELVTSRLDYSEQVRGIEGFIQNIHSALVDGGPLNFSIIVRGN